MLAMLAARIEFQLCALFFHPYAENFPCVQNTVIHLCLPASWIKIFDKKHRIGEEN